MQDDQGAYDDRTGEIGISEFYIAKRAAKKMIEWYYIAKERKAMIEQELVDEIEMRD